MKHTESPEIGAWYFGDPKRKSVARTQSIPVASVNVDWSADGEVLGVEVLHPPVGDSITIDSDDFDAKRSSWLRLMARMAGYRR